MNSSLSPVVLFAYNRPEHTLATLNALSENLLAGQTQLFICCDGPRPGASAAEIATVNEVRKIVRAKKWCGKVTVVESENNKGLANAVIAGVTKVMNEFGKAIVIEDDLLVSKYFLEYMNTALKKYEYEERVFQISGHQYALMGVNNTDASFFAPYCTSWGWGTWKRAWDKFDAEGRGWEILEQDADLRNSFNLDNSYPFAEMMINYQRHRTVDSWAIRWWWTVFRQQGLTLFPQKSLVANIGFDDSGTHAHHLKNEAVQLIKNSRVSQFPDNAVPNKAMFQKMKNMIRESLQHPYKAPSIWRRTINRFIKMRSNS